MSALQRRVQCLLLSGQSLCNYVPRLGLPYIVPFIVADMGYSAAQAASLLGAFFPGYVLTQIPLGFLAQVWGAKNVLTLNMVGSAAMLFVLPSTTRLGPQGVFACLFTLGLFQGPFVPAQSMMKRSWVPDGPEKPMMLLLVGLGSKMSRMLSAAVTPVLCAALGWRRASTVYAVCVAAFTAFWQAVARNEPRAAAPELTLQTMEELATPKANGEQIAVGTEPTEKAFESRVFTVAGIQAVMWSHVAANNTEYCLMQWAPSYFNEVLHVPLGQVGGYLAVPAAVNLAGNIAVAAVESALVKTGWSELKIRKMASSLAALIQAAGVVCFGLAQSPVMAMLSYAGVVGEVGGPDTGVVSAVGNTLANVPGMVGPMIAVWLLRTTGSWMPLFTGTAVCQLCAAALFHVCATTESARDVLARRDGQGKAHQA